MIFPQDFNCQKPRYYHIRGKTSAGSTPEKSHLLMRDSPLNEDKLDISSCKAQGPLRSPQISEPAPDGGGAWLDLHDPVIDHVLLRITSIHIVRGEFSSPIPINISFTLITFLLRPPSAWVSNKTFRYLNFLSMHTARSMCVFPYLRQCRADTKRSPLDRMDAQRSRDQGKASRIAERSMGTKAPTFITVGCSLRQKYCSEASKVKHHFPHLITMTEEVWIHKRHKQITHTGKTNPPAFVQSRNPYMNKSDFQGRQKQDL